MPELPEVETMRCDLEDVVQGHIVTDVQVIDKRVVRQPLQVFIKRLKGQMFRSFERRGKALLGHFDDHFLLIQPMMTGYVYINPPEEKPPILKETKLVLSLSKGGQLLYNDQRLFGQVRVIEHTQESTYLTHIGPEPLTDKFNASSLASMLSSRTVPIKNVLLDHRVVAGIGNIYASEILFEAGIHPERPANSLSTDEYQNLVCKTQSILREAIQCRGCSMRNYRDSRGEKGRYMNRIRVYGRTDQFCPRRDGGVIQRIVLGGRSTFFCPQCQH